MPDVTEFPPTPVIGQSAVQKSTIEKIDAALAVVAMWGALLPRFLEQEGAGPKPDSPGRHRAAMRKLRDTDAWAIALVLSRTAPEPLSLIKLARYIADEDDENLQRAARHSLQSRLLPAMRDYGLVHYITNGSGYKNQRDGDVGDIRHQTLPSGTKARGVDPDYASDRAGDGQ